MKQFIRTIFEKVIFVIGFIVGTIRSFFDIIFNFKEFKKNVSNIIESMDKNDKAE